MLLKAHCLHHFFMMSTRFIGQRTSFLTWLIHRVFQVRTQSIIKLSSTNEASFTRGPQNNFGLYIMRVGKRKSGKESPPIPLPLFPLRERLRYLPLSSSLLNNRLSVSRKDLWDRIFHCRYKRLFIH